VCCLLCITSLPLCAHDCCCCCCCCQLQDLEQREGLRAAAAQNHQWQAFIDASRPHVAKQVREHK
jgi:hypothetical protein